MRQNNILIPNNNGFPTLAEMSLCIEAKVLDGSEGSNREVSQRCQIPANNDYEAVKFWLKEYEHVSTTYRCYQKEAERLLLWCIYQLKKPLSSLDREDLESYFLFLENPEPKSFWCGPKGGRGHVRGSLTWKPFVGSLGESARSTAITIINSLLTYLMDARYLAFNPLLLKRKHRGQKEQPTLEKMKLLDKVLTPEEFITLIDTIEQLPECTPHAKDEKERTHFIVCALYLLGLRASELHKNPWGNFKQLQGNWWYLVVGKGGKTELVPVVDDMVAAMQRFRLHLGYTSFPEADDMRPLVPSWKTGQALTDRAVNYILKKIGALAAERYPNNSDSAKRLRKLSQHKFRHLKGTIESYLGIDPKHRQDNLRHAKAETTRKYDHSYLVARHKDSNKLTLHPKIVSDNEKSG